MGLRTKSKNRAADEGDEKPAATFWDDPIPASAAQPQTPKHAGESLTLQQTVERADAIRQADTQQSRAPIEHITRPRQSIRDANLIGELSTHRIARLDPAKEEAKRAAQKGEQESRAWRSLIAMRDLLSR
jgi:hypothetical protein